MRPDSLYPWQRIVCIRNFSFILSLGLILGVGFFADDEAIAQSPNFGPNVYVIDSSMTSSAIQTQLESLSNEAQFSTNRYAVLFMPGTYNIQAPVGYYESIAGLGELPSAVVINGFLTPNFGTTSPGANITTYFWRSMENMTFNPATDTAQNAGPNTLQWGVSQGAPLRRLQINGSLELTDSYCGYASGGFISDIVVTGNVNPCSQQQWYSRNSSYGSWSGGVWNMVFSGVEGSPSPNYPTNVDTILPNTPVSREKPFLYVDSNSNYNVFVPTLRTNSSGVSWAMGTEPGYSLPISTFFIAQPSTTLAAINTALAAGQNLILTTGIYQYSGTINVTNPDTVILGLGYADLVPQTGTAAITVSDVDGVQIAGIMIDAGPVTSPVLMQIGVPNATRVSHQSDPTSIHDVFFRVGGATAGAANITMEIDSDNVILDDIWAWRADHGTGVGWTSNIGLNGVIVNGDNVTALGLAVEHYQQNQVVWNGNNGETIFYQSELPYDVPSQSDWMTGNIDGYASYFVSSGVTSHQAYGMGVYSYFDQGINIVETSAISVPGVVGASVTDAVSVFLNGSGSITSTVNNAGTSVNSGNGTSYVSFYQGAPCTTTCPPTPANLTAITISATQINLTWTESASTGVLYSVFRGTAAGFTPSAANQLTSGTTGTSYADTTISPSTTYYYLVQAHNGSGFSAVSNDASATTPAGGGIIASDIVRIDAGGAAVSPWVADEDFSGGGTYATSAAINTSNVTNATPAPQAVYQSNREGTFTYTIPGLTASGSYVVDLHFAETYFSTSGSREFDVLINNVQVLTNFDIVAAAGGEDIANVQSFYATADNTGTITIQFVSGAVDQPEVNGVEIGTSSTPAPGAASGLVATSPSDTQIDLSWTASSGTGIQYEVFRSTVSGFTPLPVNLVTTTSTTTYSDSQLQPSTTYYYIVLANNSTQSSSPTPQVSATTVNGPPGSPFGLTAATISASQVTLNWKASVTSGVQYQLYRSTTAGFTPSSSNLLTTTSSTTYADSSVVASTQYYYVVEANDSFGTSMPSSYAATMTTPPPAFTVTMASASMTVMAGSSGNLQVSVTPLYGFAGTVSFACSGLPTGATCSFSPATVTQSGSTSATTTLTVATSASIAFLHAVPTPLHSNPLFPSVALAAGLWFFGWKTRRISRLLLFAMSLCGGILVLGCGSATSSTAPVRQPVTSAVTVTATSGTLQSTSSFSLIVQ